MSYRFERSDELMHRPSAEPHFNESVYCNGFDGVTGVGGWMRLGNRVNEGYAELSVCLYLPDGRIVCQFQRPKIQSNERFDAGGLRYSVATPPGDIRMSYSGELLVVRDPELLRHPEKLFTSAERSSGTVELELQGDSPIHGGVPTSDEIEPMYGRNFSLGHFNQHTRVTGEITCGNDKFKLDGFGWRDHSWGPRLWQNIYYYRLFLANLGHGRGFMLLKITDTSGRTRRLGVLLVDGKYEEVVEFDLFTEWTDRQDPSVVRLAVKTQNRTAIIVGEVLNVAPLRNRRKIDGETVVSRIAEAHTKFSWDGQTGFGMTEYIERIEGDTLVGFPM